MSAALFGGAAAMLGTLVSGGGWLWFVSLALILVAGVLAAFEYAAELNKKQTTRR